MTTIVLADDHPIVRLGLRALLATESDFTVIGEAEDGKQAIDMVTRLKPDVLIADLIMPRLSGIDVIRRMHQQSPRTRVIILSMHMTEPHVLEALRAGAAGYVIKATSTTHLVQAVREVVAGQRYLSPPLSEWAIEAFLQQSKSAAAGIDRYSMLTAREQEVLLLVVQNHTNAAIAAQLSISPRTVETHRTNLMRKLDLHTQGDLIRYAIQHELLPPNQ
jgi:two-component system, NarL family, response regulator NreC